MKCQLYITIYKLTSPNGKIYIGKTKNFKQRMSAHKSSATRKKGKRSLIMNSIAKYGFENFKKEKLFQCHVSVADQWEQCFINAFQSKVPHGLNLTDGGDGGHGMVVTDATRKRMSIAHIGQKRTPEQCENISAALKGRVYTAQAIESYRLGGLKLQAKRKKVGSVRVKHCQSCTKYEARVMIRRKRFHLGSFESENDARDAIEKKVQEEGGIELTDTNE